MILLGHDGQGRLELEGRCELTEHPNEECNDENIGNDSATTSNKSKISHRFFKKLKVTKYPSTKRKIRMDYG